MPFYVFLVKKKIIKNNKKKRKEINQMILVPFVPLDFAPFVDVEKYIFRIYIENAFFFLYFLYKINGRNKRERINWVEYTSLDFSLLALQNTFFELSLLKTAFLCIFGEIFFSSSQQKKKNINQTAFVPLYILPPPPYILKKIPLFCMLIAKWLFCIVIEELRKKLFPALDYEKCIFPLSPPCS